MKIESANILLTSQHNAIEKNTVQESLNMWVGNRRPDFEGRAHQHPQTIADTVKISAQALALSQADQGKQVSGMDPEKDLKNDPRYQMMILMIEALTGKKIKLVKLEDMHPATTLAESPSPNSAAPQQQQAGFGIEYDRHETHYEAEQTSFSANGIVKTADGMEIRFNLDLVMSREYIEQSDVSVRAGDATMKKDPLVINFGSTAAQLTDTKFSFDLDTDGQTDQISFVGAGSGFLALDKNGDSKINNGMELFGTSSGNGFEELAAYDLDKNSWIDENDAVYSQLRVWTKDASGNDALDTLAQKQVGAIYLGNANTQFDIKNGQNQLNGQVKTSSIYLNENGDVSTVQQIDLVVKYSQPVNQRSNSS